MKTPRLIRIMLAFGLGLAVFAGLIGGIGHSKSAFAAEPQFEAGLLQPEPLQPIVIQSTKNDTSPPLRDLVAADLAVKTPLPNDGVIPLSPDPKVIGDGVTDQSIVQSQLVGSSAMPLPIHNFEGTSSLDNHFQAGGQVVPPDTNGDIGWDPGSGDKYYMQWNNLTLAAWDVTDPNNVQLILGPAAGNILFTGFGGPCETTNDGDPIALFDHLANRWLASQFGNTGAGPPFYQCVAISQTPDPSGAWFRYAFVWPNGFNDYPKFGVWPDAYYMSANQFTGATGAGVMAFERDELLLGNPAQAVYFDVSAANSTYRSLLPADLDGPPPPMGTPNYFAAWHDASTLPPNDAMHLWEFHVDWTTPANSTFGLSSLPNEVVATTNVDPNMCGGARQCIPQPGGTNVNSLAPRLMNRLAYRYNAGAETLVANHTVDVDGADHAGVHWMELGKNAGPWSMVQEGVYAPDSDNRWMGGIAMDQAGNIALGYSVSSVNTYPSIRYAGRLASDPLGSLPQSETELIAGSGYQETPFGRWGDYSMMGVDPSDDCTFWYTQEYYEVIGDRPWQTRVGSFVFPSCLGPVGDLNGTVTDSGSSLPIEGAQLYATAPLTNPVAATSNTSGEYAMILGAGTYTVTAGAYGYTPVELTGVSILSGTTTVQDFALDQANTYVVDGTVTDGTAGWPLYSHVMIEGDPFDPPSADADFWTDPVTGYYSVTLAEGVVYTITVEASTGGYLPGIAAVGPLTVDTTQDFALSADLNVCQAPGYLQNTTYFEDFEASDGGYTVGPGEWEWGTPTFPAGITPFSGVNVWGTDLDDTADDQVPGGSHILTATLNVPAGGGILQWWDWFSASDSNDHREVTVNGTTVWDDGLLVAAQTYWKKQYADLSPWAGQTVSVEFRLNMIGTNPGADGWYFDNVGIAESGTCAPQAGGLVIGNVYDADTFNPLVGAAIANDSGEAATAMATPDDPLVDDAFYTIFSEPGTGVFTATMPGYAPGIEMPTVVQSDTIRQDFYLTSTLPLIGISPSSLASSQASGLVITQPLTITNSGNGDLDWSILEAPAPTHDLLVDWFDDFDSYATGSQIHGQGGWKGWSNDPNVGAIVTDVVSLSTPNSVDIVGLSDLVHEYSGYNAGYWTYTAWQYIPSPLSGETYFIMLNQYDDAGATNNWSVQVHFNGASGLVIADGVGAGATLPLITDQWVEIRLEIDLEGDNQAFYYDNQLLYQGSWTDGLSGGGILNIGAVDLFANGASSAYYDDLSLVENIPNPCDFPIDLPWLSVMPDTGMTPPGSSDSVGVGFDSTGLGIGTYEGTLCVTSNDLVTPLVEVPVSMTVTADPPSIAVVPTTLESTQVVTSVVTTTLSISNAGGLDLDWSLYEDAGPAPAAAVDGAISRSGTPDTTPPIAYESPADFSEGFDDITILPGWAMDNNPDVPGATDWFQGNDTVFPAHAGAPTAYIGANFNNTGGSQISNWLMTPELDLSNGDVLRFWTRTVTGSTFPDRLQVRLSLAGASVDVGTAPLDVGDFTTLLLDINETLTAGGYPDVWTPYTVTLSAIPAGSTGRLAFRYYVPTDAGPTGSNSNYIGIDTVDFTAGAVSPCSVPSDIPWFSVDPISGITAPGQTSLVEATFNSTGLSTGVYTGTLCVDSNDPVTPLVTVPLTMTVVPVPARLQVAHLAPFAMDPGTAVTITLNGTAVLTNFAYTDSTVYLDLTPGSYLVEIFPGGSGSPAITGTVDLMSGVDYTAIAIGDGVNQPLSLLAMVDDNSAPAAGNFKLRLGHLAPFANTLAGTTADIRLDDGTAVLTDVVFGAVSPYLELPAGTYDLKITTPGGGTTLINLAPVTFVDGQILSAFATGDGVNQPLGGYALPSGQLGFVLPLEGNELYLPLVPKN